MNIDEMSEQEKSVALAKLCGWDVEDIGFGKKLIIPSGENSLLAGVSNLYDLANIALLAKVIEWACENLESIFDMGPIGYFMHYFNPKDFHGSMCRMVDEILRQDVSAEMIERP